MTDEKTKKEELKPVVKDSEKVLKLLADSWRMAQEINKAIPVLEEAAKLSKDGETFVLLGNLYLAEDKLEQGTSIGVSNKKKINSHFELITKLDAYYFRDDVSYK